MEEQELQEIARPLLHKNQLCKNKKGGGGVIYKVEINIKNTIHKDAFLKKSQWFGIICRCIYFTQFDNLFLKESK